MSLCRDRCHPTACYWDPGHAGIARTVHGNLNTDTVVTVEARYGMQELIDDLRIAETWEEQKKLPVADVWGSQRRWDNRGASSQWPSPPPTGKRPKTGGSSATSLGGGQRPAQGLLRSVLLPTSSNQLAAVLRSAPRPRHRHHLRVKGE